MSEISITESDWSRIPNRGPAYIHQDGFLVNTEKANDAVYVNATALMVWGMCNGEITLEEISMKLEQAYPENREQVRDDVMLAMGRLVAHGVVFLSP